MKLLANPSELYPELLQGFLGLGEQLFVFGLRGVFFDELLFDFLNLPGLLLLLKMQLGQLV